MNLARTAWAKTRAIARVELQSYLRSVALWISLLLVLAFTVWSSNLGRTRTMELFLGSGEALAVLLSSFVLTLLITAGIAREEREGSHDLWNSLPVRNAQQFWGKVLGASGPALLFGIGLLALLPLGWLVVGTVWTDATTSVVWAYVAQTVGFLTFSLGIASFLRGLISNLRLRYVLGLLIVVALSIAQAIGIDNQALWAVLLSPYMLGSLPYDQSLLFGMWPWEPAVVWHIIFQLAFSMTLLLSGRVLYEKKRDPQQRALGVGVLIALLSLCAIASGTMYMRYWDDVRTTVAAQHHHDVKPGLVVAEGGQDGVRPVAQSHVRAHGYDLQVQAAGDGHMQITADVVLSGDPGQPTWPLTLHHQWQVHHVYGEGVRGWSREGNFIWLEVAPGSSSVHAVVEYEGRPLLWHWQVGRISPMHFMGGQGGYLSPTLAWYPLPGQRRLVTSVTDMRESRRWLWPVTEPLLPEPVPMRLHWEGADELAVISNLDMISYTETEGSARGLFQGRSDGISVLVGPMTHVAGPGFTLIGAASVVHGADVLQGPYEKMITFYEELIGRSLPKEPVIAVPGWLVAFHSPYSFRLSVAQGTPTYVRVLTLLGGKLAATEQALASAIRAAERWVRTESPHELLNATSAIGYSLLQSIWGRPYTFQALHEKAAAFGVAQYTLLRWWEHVWGPAAQVREGIYEGSRLHSPNERDRLVQQVLVMFLEIEESQGEPAVRTLLGSIYDYMATEPITMDVLQQLAAEVTGDGVSNQGGWAE